MVLCPGVESSGRVAVDCLSAGLRGLCGAVLVLSCVFTFSHFYFCLHFTVGVMLSGRVSCSLLLEEFLCFSTNTDSLFDIPHNLICVCLQVQKRSPKCILVMQGVCGMLMTRKAGQPILEASTIPHGLCGPRLYTLCEAGCCWTERRHAVSS